MKKISIEAVYGKVPEISKDWDQRKTLKPPIFLGPMARIAKGIDIGDPRIDALPISAVSCHGSEPRKIGMDPHPPWVDWESIRRGQDAYLNLLGPSYMALTFALLQGFTIARFAEVLFHNGYAQSADTAYERYRETSFAIMDWMTYPIDEPDSRAQLQLQNVRAMHSFARRRSQKLFDQSKGEGVALSQFDMAEVLIGFAGVAIDGLVNELGIHIDRRAREDLCHTWRLIGYHLGIMDEYNPCTSLDELEAIMREWIPYTPLRMMTCRPATFELQRTAVEGFGKYTGIGKEFYAAGLYATLETRDWGMDVNYLKYPYLPGVKELSKNLVFLGGNSTINYVMGGAVLRLRSAYLNHPTTVRKVLPYVAMVSRWNDAVTWPILDKIVLIYTTALWRRLVLAALIVFLFGSRLARSRRHISRMVGLN